MALNQPNRLRSMSRILPLIILLITILPSLTNAQVDDERITAYLSDESHHIDIQGLLPAVEATRYFVKWTRMNWKSAVTSLPEFAKSTREQALFVVAGEFLAPSDYIVFVDSLCALRETEKIPPTILRRVLLASMQKRGFLGYNYQVPEVARLASRLETQIGKDFPGVWDGYFSALKSGELKKNIVASRMREGEQMPETWDGNRASRDGVKKAPVSRPKSKEGEIMTGKSSESGDVQATSLITWSIIGVVIGAGIGLVWLAFRRRS